MQMQKLLNPPVGSEWLFCSEKGIAAAAYRIVEYREGGIPKGVLIWSRSADFLFGGEPQYLTNLIPQWKPWTPEEHADALLAAPDHQP